MTLRLFIWLNALTSSSLVYVRTNITTPAGKGELWLGEDLIHLPESGSANLSPEGAGKGGGAGCFGPSVMINGYLIFHHLSCWHNFTWASEAGLGTVGFR